MNAGLTRDMLKLSNFAASLWRVALAMHWAVCGRWFSFGGEALAIAPGVALAALSLPRPLKAVVGDLRAERRVDFG